MYIKQIANTLRTFGECSLNTHEIECETLRQFPTSTTKWVANTPPIPHVHHEMGCEHSVRRRGPIHRARILTLPNTHIHFTAHAFPPPFHRYLRICGRDKSAPTAADDLPITWRTLWNTQRTPSKLVRNTPPGVGDRFIVPVSWHYQLHIFVSPHTHIPIIKYVFSSHHAHIFALPYQYIRFLLFIILNIKHPIQHIYTRKLHKLFLRLFSHKNTESCLTLHLIYMYAP